MKQYIYTYIILFFTILSSLGQSKSISQEKAPEKPEKFTRVLAKEVLSASEIITIIFENKNGNIFVSSIYSSEFRVSSPQKNKEELEKILDIKSTKGNEVYISSKKIKDDNIDLYLEIPKNSNLKITKTGKGRVEVSGLEQLIDINTQEDIVLKEVAGWTNLNTIDGNIEANFDRVNTQQNMTFLSLNGDINLTFPEDLQANFKIKNTSTLVNDFSPVILDTTLVKKNITKTFAYPVEQQKSEEVEYKEIDVKEDNTILEEVTVISAKKDKKDKFKKMPSNLGNVATNSNSYNNNNNTYNKASTLKNKEFTNKLALRNQYQLPQTQNFKSEKTKVLFFISTREGKVFIHKK